MLSTQIFPHDHSVSDKISLLFPYESLFSLISSFPYIFTADLQMGELD